MAENYFSTAVYWICVTEYGSTVVPRNKQEERRDERTMTMLEMMVQCFQQSALEHSYFECE